MNNYKLNFLAGIIALSILIPVRMLPHSFFRSHSFMLWLSATGVLVFVLLEAFYYLNSERRTQSPGGTRDLAGNFFLGSKIVSGVALLTAVLLVVIQVLFGLFSASYRLDFKLLISFAVLFSIGAMFLKDPETYAWLEKKIRWLIPYLKEYASKIPIYTERARMWATKQKYITAGILVAVLLLSTLPFLLSTPDLIRSELTVSVIPDSLFVTRDYDQKVPVFVNNDGLTQNEIFLEVEQLSREDTLILGFMGKGSRFQDVQPATIYARAGVPEKFYLRVHAATARHKFYPVKIKLYKIDTASTDGFQLVDSKKIEIEVKSDPVNVSFEQQGEADPNSLGVRYVVTNLGNVISDFSLIPDSALKDKIKITPDVKLFRFGKNERLSVLIEPVLHVGFSGVQGNLLVTGGGSTPILRQLAFHPPAGKKLFLAAASCGSHGVLHINECINKKRMGSPLPPPPGFNGAESHDPNSGTELRRPDPPLPTPAYPEVPDGTDEGEEETDSLANEAESAEPLQRGFIDEEDATKEQILARVENVAPRFKYLAEKFTSANAQEKIKQGQRNLDQIRKIVADNAILNPEIRGRINELLQDAIEVYDQLTDEATINARRGDLTEAIGPNFPSGSVNLRLDQQWLSVNNAAAPMMHFTPAAVHFAWHRKHRTGQSVFYSAHERNGKLANAIVDLTPAREWGQWPFVVAGDKTSELFYTWQGNRQGFEPDIKLRVSVDAGKSWSEPKNITSHGRGTYSPRLVYTNNKLCASWVDFYHGNPELVFAHSTNKGASFSAPQPIATQLSRNAVAKFEVVNDRIHFVYEKSINGVPYIMYQTFRFGGTGQEVWLSEGVNPSIKADDRGNIHAAYSVGKDNNSEIFYRVSNDHGSTWHAPVQVTRDKAYSISPSFSLNEGAVQMLYHSNAADTTKFIDNFYLTELKASAYEWSPAYRLPNLTANTRNIFLSLKFKLPWDRRIYNEPLAF